MRFAGKIVRFDEIRGYGFIAPDVGGDDVFLHANDLEFEKALARPGSRVTFDIEDGPRGKFATAVRQSMDVPAQERHAKEVDSTSDDYYDVLSLTEFRRTVTEILLDAAPTITAEQIRQVRAAFENLARKHGWAEP